MMTTRKKLIYAIIIVIIAAAVTIGVFMIVFRPQTKQTDSSTVSKTTAVSITTAFATDVNNGKTLKAYTLATTAEDAQANILLTDKKTNSLVQVSGKQIAVIKTSDVLSPTNITEVTVAVKSFLENKGFTSDDKKVTGDSSVLLRESTDDIACQLIANQILETETFTDVTLVCTDINDHKAELEVVNQLIESWSDKGSATIGYLTQDLSSNDKYSVMVINNVDAKTNTRLNTLVFVKKDNTWTYIGDASKGDQSLSTGKYILNDAIKKGVSNPDYGTYLKEVLSTSPADRKQ